MKFKIIEKEEEKMEELLEILNEIDDSIDYENETALIDDQLLDSFAIITLVSELEDAFDISIDAGELQFSKGDLGNGTETSGRLRFQKSVNDPGGFASCQRSCIPVRYQFFLFRQTF